MLHILYSVISDIEFLYQVPGMKDLQFPITRLTQAYVDLTLTLTFVIFIFTPPLKMKLIVLN